MKGAIASIEVFARRGDEPVQRLSLVVAEPSRQSGESDWTCRVALANLHRAERIAGRDSVEALTLALAQGRAWLRDLQAEGFVLYRNREGDQPYDF